MVSGELNYSDGFDEASGSLAATTNEEQGDIDALEWQSVDWNLVRAERVVGWIVFALLTIGGLIAMTSITVVGWPPELGISLAWVGYAVFSCLLFWVVHVLPAIQYRHLFYRLGPLGFEIRRGILWRRRITVPISRVQHVDVAQGPLQRRYEIGKVVIFTAGTQNASVELEGLRFLDANALRDSLVAVGEATDGV